MPELCLFLNQTSYLFIFIPYFIFILFPQLFLFPVYSYSIIVFIYLLFILFHNKDK